jgi:hypothetical protein
VGGSGGEKKRWQQTDGISLINSQHANPMVEIFYKDHPMVGWGCIAMRVHIRLFSNELYTYSNAHVCDALYTDITTHVCPTYLIESHRLQDNKRAHDSVAHC